MKGPVIKLQALVSRDPLPPARSYPTPRGSITSKNIKSYPARDQVLKHVGLEVGVREETLSQRLTLSQKPVTPGQPGINFVGVVFPKLVLVIKNNNNFCCRYLPSI